MLFGKRTLRPGESVLIVGGGSGLAVANLQLAKLICARVFVTASSVAKIARATELGAKCGVNYTKDRVSKVTETTACEWATAGVRVNAVAPGGLASSGFDTYPPDAQAKILAFPPMIPLQRFGTESEISAAIVYLLSAAAAYVTGACLRVDGGAPNARRASPLATAQHNLSFNEFHRSFAPELLRNKL
jgi:NAD(P)-dependent dehydrogenase (short-subunit alcohol dehydrogenase family)